MQISVKNLRYVYNPKTLFEKQALRGIDLDVEEGDFLGIIGKTGSGKSTLINHLNGLTRVQKKYNRDTALTVCGIDLTHKPDLKSLREKVGMVFQYPEYQLFADTVRLDVAFGAKNLGFSEEETDVRVREAIARVGLNYDEIAERSPFELSGGQKRRVAIAGVLVMRPEVLILDEPTAGLDPAGKKSILSLIRSIKTDCHTVVMVSHNMDEVAECCNKVAVLGDGEIMGVYTPDELFGQKDLIYSLGLELPTVTALADYLHAGGIAVESSTLTEADLIKQLTK